jgi:hypothetical protein
MLVAYKVVIPETGEKHIFDVDQYNQAIERWHEEIAWLDCDTYLVALHVNETVGEEQIMQWYLRDPPAFSCPTNCSWCMKLGIARSRYLGVSPIKAAEEARKKYDDWQEGRITYPVDDDTVDKAELDPAARRRSAAHVQG